jgi:hypothetical protein
MMDDNRKHVSSMNGETMMIVKVFTEDTLRIHVIYSTYLLFSTVSFKNEVIFKESFRNLCVFVCTIRTNIEDHQRIFFRESLTSCVKHGKK